MNDKSLIGFYWRNVFLTNKRESSLLIGLMIIGALFEMAVLGLCAPLLNVAAQSNAVPQGRIVHLIEKIFTSFNLAFTPQRALLALLMTVCVLAVIHAVFTVWQLCWTAEIQEKMRREMKSKIFEHILNATYDHLNKQNRGTLIYDMTQPPRSLERAVGYFGKMLSSLFSVGAIIGLLFYLSWKATIVIGVLGAAGVGLWRLYTEKKSIQYGRELYDLETKVGQIEVDAVDGLKVVKSFGLIDTMKNWHSKLLLKELRPTLLLTFFASAPRAMNTLVASALVIGLSIAVFGFGLFSMQFAQLVVFFVALRQLGPTLATINSSFTELSREKKNIEVIDQTIHQIPQEERTQTRATLGSVETVTFKDLTFFYPSHAERLILDHFDLEMKKGTVTAIVGSTGAGKSTIANLLVSLYRPVSGSILVNGQSIEEVGLSSWRQRIGYVGQDVFLFNATIEENITLWDSSVTQADIERVMQLAQIQEFVRSLPEGLQTRVGDRGFRLSGGQCQRLAVARAILRRPEILIFDEATSALDTLTEKAIYNAIGTLRSNAVVLVIAHRLSTVRDADQIIVLENGKAAETGTHAQLLAKNGKYTAFYEEHKQGNDPTAMEAIQA